MPIDDIPTARLHTDEMPAENGMTRLEKVVNILLACVLVVLGVLMLLQPVVV